MKHQMTYHRFGLGLAASVLLTAATAHAREEAPPSAGPTESDSAPGRNGLIIDVNLHGRAWPLVGGGVGVLLGAKLGRFVVGGGLDVFMPPGPPLLVPRVEAQFAFMRTPDQRVELFGLAGYGWAMAMGDQINGYFGPDLTWGPVRAGIGIRYWSNSTFGAYLNMGVDVSPSHYGDSEGDSSADSICFTPFARLGVDFAITK